MTRHLSPARRARGEEGVVLAWALAFLVVVGIVVFFVLGYTSTSINSSTRLANQRSALYAVDGAVNNAIRYVQNNANAGVQGGSNNACPSPVALNSQSVSVQCTPSTDSGTATPPSSAPPFAILTLAPFTNFWDTHGYGGNSYPGCSSVSTDTDAELGIVQVQNDKALTVNGDVYVNSDVDADTWNNHCPNISAARAIQVNGNAIVKESCHDLFAAPGATPPYGWYCDQNGTSDNKTLADAGRNPTGGWASAPAGLQQNLVDPAIANPTLWAPAATTAPAPASLPTCSAASKLVTFTPGTYTNGTALSNLMNGTNPNCAGHLFWFQPGTYYFNFPTNSNTWTVNDGGARIVGGTPNAVPSGATPVGPVTVVAKNPPAPTTGFVGNPTPNPAGYQNTTGALVIGDAQSANTGTANNSFTTSNQQRWITTGGYAITPSIPGGSSGLSVTARVVHAESYATAAQIGVPQLLVRDAGDTTTRCTIPLTRSATSAAAVDETVAIPANCNLDAATLNSGSFTLRYQVTHGTCGANPACTNVMSSLDGIQLKVNYTTPARPAWNPSDSSTVTTTSPTVPGACVHDGDYGFGPNSGVQFIFSGSSHVVLKSGAWELCPNFSSTHQEIVMYSGALPSPGVPVTGTFQPQTATPSPTPTFTTNPDGGRFINDGQVATGSLSSGNTTRSLTVTNFTRSPGGPVPTGATITNVTMRVRHRENNSGSTNNPTITITPGGAGACTAQTGDDNNNFVTESFDVTACLNSPAKINGASALYRVTRSSGTTNVDLDGIELDVTYTPAATGGGGIAQPSGCITQVPYYGPNHEPGYNGACALFSVASNANGGTAPRVAVFWGTVYAPSAALDVPVDVLTVPVFDRGVVARMLMLGYNVASNAQVPISSTPITANIPNNREVTFTATIPGATTKLEADVVFCDSTFDPRCAGVAAGGTKVQSWKVTR